MRPRKLAVEDKAERLKNEILSRGYELSLAFVDRRTSRRLNKTYRGKDKSTNVLSFPISKKSGEIIIDLDTAKKESAKFGMSFQKFVEYLFIHGLLHLKGMRHGAKMDQLELKLLNGTSNRSRN